MTPHLLDQCGGEPQCHGFRPENLYNLIAIKVIDAKEGLKIATGVLRVLLKSD
jgi:hypothetical protein